MSETGSRNGTHENNHSTQVQISTDWGIPNWPLAMLDYQTVPLNALNSFQPFLGPFQLGSGAWELQELPSLAICFLCRFPTAVFDIHVSLRLTTFQIVSRYRLGCVCIVTDPIVGIWHRNLVSYTKSIGTWRIPVRTQHPGAHWQKSTLDSGDPSIIPPF